MEIWKDIEGYEGHYQVSNLGNIKSLDRKVWNYIKKSRVLKPTTNGHNYSTVALSNGVQKQKHAYIHILVAKAFVPNVDNKLEVNHIDHNKQNNNADNLEWVTRQENLKHFRTSPNYQKRNIKHQETRERKFDLMVYKHKDSVVTLYDQGHTVLEISKQEGIGRDFVTRILRMHGRLK